MENKDFQQLPRGWAKTTIRELSFLVTKGSTPTTYGFKYQPQGINFIKIENIENAQINRKSITQFITQEANEFLKRSQIEEKDILLSIAGTIGRVGIVKKDDLPANTNQALAIIRCPWQYVNPSYLRLFLESPSTQQAIKKRPRGVGMNNISLEDVKDVEALLPPFNEQQRIVGKVEELFSFLDTGVASLKAVQTQLKRYRQAVLKAAFEGKLTTCRNDDNFIAAYSRLEEPVLQQENILKKLPLKWIWVKFEEVTFSQNGRSFPSKQYTNKGIRLLRPGNLHVSGRIIWTNENTRYLPKEFAERYPDFIIGENEIIMNLTAQSLKDDFLGRVCLTESGENALLNQRQARIRPKKDIDVKYLFWLLKSPIFRRFVRGLEKGTLIQHMFTWQINDFMVPLAPIEEQRKIVEKIESLLSICNESKTIDTLLFHSEQIRQGILKNAFEGKLVPQDPNDEPAEKLLKRINGEYLSKKSKNNQVELSKYVK